MSIRVAVSGVTGFIGSHVARDLLLRNYIVHGTVRRNTPERIAHLTSVQNSSDNLRIFEADLLTPNAFDDAVKDCKYAIHVASPYTMNVKDPQKELVDPAVNGTLSFLQSCKAAGVEKVVLTSSTAAITDEGRENYVFSEKDYNTKSSIKRLPYYYSKAKAEEEAWKFIKEEAPHMKLVVINPIIVVGPSLSKVKSSSADMLVSVINGEFGGIMDFEWVFVDVRDVSEAHIRAMESENAEGRYLCAAMPSLSMREVTEIATSMDFKPAMRDLTSPLISKMIKTFSYIFPGGQMGVYVRNHLGLPFKLSNEKVVKDLKMNFRDPKETVRETFEDMIKWGHISKP